MIQELLPAIQEGRIWLDQFHRRTYRVVFAKYKARFAPAYRAAVQQCADEEALRALAEEILDGVEEGWKHQRIWNRSAARVDEKQVIVNYLSPMLLDTQDPGCIRLAELLRDGWNARRPKDTYRIATYERITKGFRNAILGIDLNNRHMEEGVDEDMDD